LEQKLKVPLFIDEKYLLIQDSIPIWKRKCECAKNIL
jgi:hypothetical protein